MPDTSMAPGTALALGSFLPYRLSVLSNHISDQLARAYRGRFGLSIPEWRVMAILGSDAERTAQDIVEASAMDKVAVHRAVTRLVERTLVASADHAGDRRKRLLKLTPNGRAIYDEVVPLALSYQRALLAGLPADVRAQLTEVIGALEASAAAMGDWR